MKDNLPSPCLLTKSCEKLVGSSLRLFEDDEFKMVVANKNEYSSVMPGVATQHFLVVN